MRPSGRAPDEMRPVRFQTGYTRHAEGSVLASFGDTRVICTASVEEKLPRWMEPDSGGWITAEYGMLPRATHTRTGREASRGRQGGRTMEIQRLIGRSLRAAVDLDKLGPRTITIDCDVIQADGGTRTAAISGGFVALALALETLKRAGRLEDDPLRQPVAAVSVGIFQGQPILDLDYAEDSAAETDMNLVMNRDLAFIEIQGTAEGAPFGRDELDRMIDLARKGIGEIVAAQQIALEAHQIGT